jgi:XTP/dITP diphosphohydrolase
MNILMATKNPGKVVELNSLMAGVPHNLVGLNDFPEMIEVSETGSTFAENARLKATAYARASGLHSIADDSGLEVAALKGAPGVFSARYGGIETGYAQKIDKLLEEIITSGNPNRSARFVSHIVFAQPDGNILFEAEGICVGNIARAPRGTNGFGYDPVFIPTGYEQTFGELDEDVKHQISHRAVAAAKIIRFLHDLA